MEPSSFKMHGVEIVDPYLWLEDGESGRVRRWTEEQNAWTRAHLDALPKREEIKRRLGELLSIGNISPPVPRKGRYFYTRREGQQNQPILYVRDGLHGRDRVLIDPNGLSPDGTVALDWWYPSPDGKLLAYGLSRNGDERSTLYILDVDTGRNLTEAIPNTRAASVAWLPDSSGFFYTRFPAPGSVPKGEENYHRRVFLHKLGTDPTKDEEIYRREERPSEWPSVELSRDGRWLLISVGRGWAANDLYIRDLRREDARLIPVAEGREAIFDGAVIGDKLYIRTTEGAPHGRILVVDAANPRRDAWREVVPESAAATIESFAIIGGKIFVNRLERASSRLSVYTLDGKLEDELKLPTLGSIGGVTGEEDGTEAFFGFSSFAFPPTVYRYDLRGKRTDRWESVEAPGVDPRSVEVKQVFYPSKDGTRVSLFLVYRKDLRFDGDRPTLLYGYGGFNISLTPSFNRGLYLWLEHGGVYAVANLRGGGEYGEEWHRAGMLERKQNVFDDFIAAAEHLIRERVTNPKRLAIQGGSNGGLLVAAALTQRPDLFRAVVCQVPLTDMLRYHRFLIAKLWIPEYGSADDPQQFKYLYAYSPYHRVRKGERYPATLITTAESDTRVDPLHARKFAAALQAANASENPILLRVETKAGHGAGKPLSKQLEEATDIWSFLFWRLGLSF
ncbi:prolyl oligopeptidase family serine peptidase [Pyrinomonas methylaliphatogenes]|nr:prolyl oligopeptidase family serine peptidase [Pyrinomonas methylaliphatogenes]